MNSKDYKKILETYDLALIFASFHVYKKLVDYLEYIGDLIVCASDYTSYNWQDRDLGIDYNGSVFEITNKSLFDMNPLKEKIEEEFKKSKTTYLTPSRYQELIDEAMFEDFKKNPLSFQKFIFDVMMDLSYNMCMDAYDEPDLFVGSVEWKELEKEYPFFIVIDLTSSEIEEFEELYDCEC